MLNALLHHVNWVQAQDFFEPLPRKIIAALRKEACIPTEHGTWVCPEEAIICTGHDAARHLLADPVLTGITTASYVDSRLAVLHDKVQLARALGIKQLDCQHLVRVLEQVHRQELFPVLGQQWCAQMLACIFDMLAKEQPSLNSMKPHATSLRCNGTVRAVMEQVKGWPMFLLTSGGWGSVKAALGDPLFMPVLMPQPPASMLAASEATAASASDSVKHQSVGNILHRCNLQADSMQLRMVNAGFLAAAGERCRDSLLRMMQASTLLLH